MSIAHRVMIMYLLMRDFFSKFSANCVRVIIAYEVHGNH